MGAALPSAGAPGLRNLALSPNLARGPLPPMA